MSVDTGDVSVPGATVIEINPTGLVETVEDWAKAADPDSSDTRERERIVFFTLINVLGATSDLPFLIANVKSCVEKIFPPEVFAGAEVAGTRFLASGNCGREPREKRLPTDEIEGIAPGFRTFHSRQKRNGEFFS